MRVVIRDVGRMGLRLALGAAALYGLACGVLYTFQAALVYAPHTVIVATPDEVGMAYREAFFTTADGVRLTGWHLPLEEARGTVLFCHGNAGNISHLMPDVRAMHALKLSVFLFDYRGYGISEGEPTEMGTHLDAAAAWAYLVAERGVDPARIIVVGRSLGGPIAARLALQQHPAALFLEATFTSLPEVGQEIYPFFPVGWLSRFQYPTLEYLRMVECPVLVSHSRDDGLIPFAHGQRLYQAAREPKAFTQLRGRHIAAFREQADIYGAGIENFLVNTLGW